MSAARSANHARARNPGAGDGSASSTVRRAAAPPTPVAMLGRWRHLGNRTIGAVLQRMCASCASGGPACDHCADEEEEPRLQRAADGVSSAVSPPSDVPSSVRAELSAPGTPLPLDTRLVMQERFGHDFAGVRVHTGSRAAASARDVGALAYTVGSHVVFGHGQYAAGSPRSQYLLSHELAHVVQQRNARVDLDRLAIDGSTTSPAEREATAVADRVSAGLDVSSVSGAREATLQRKLVEDETAGGCGICHNPETAGGYVHKLVQSRFEIDYVLKVMDPATKAANYQGPVKFIELPLGALGAAQGDENRRLDLARVENDEIYIGEIKPANSVRVAEGTKQLGEYADAIEKALGRRPKGMTDKIDMSDAAMPNPQIKDCPRAQYIFLNAPTPEGLYTYYCQPTRKELWADKACRCWSRRRKKKEERKPQDVEVPETRGLDKVKDVRGPRAVDQPVQEPEAPVRQPAEEPVREPPKEEPAETPKTKPGDGDGPGFPIWAKPGEPGSGDKTKPTDRPKPWWEGKPANDNQEVEEKKKHLAALVALAAGLATAAKLLPKGVLKRVLGPAYLAAIFVGCAKGAEITIGAGEDPLEALFKNAESQGVTIPDDIKDALDKDPALKKILIEAAQGGAKLTEAEAKIAEQITRTIIENRDQFTDEELKALAEMSEKSKGAIPNSEVTLEEIKKTLANRQAGTSPTPSPFTKPKEEGPTVTAGEMTIGGETPAPPPKEEPAEDVAIPPELNERLEKDKPTRKLFEGLLTEEKGVKPNKALVEELLAIVASAKPPLDEKAVDELLKLVESSEGKSRAEALDTIRKAIAKRAAAQGAPSQPTGAPQPPPTPGPVAPKPEEKKEGAPQPSPTVGTPGGTPAPTPPQPAADKEREDTIKKLKDPATIARYKGVKSGKIGIVLDPAEIPKEGTVLRGRLVGRSEKGQLLMGSCTVTFGPETEEGAMIWSVTISDVALYNRSGPYPNPNVGITVVDGRKWAIARAKRAKARARKKRQ